MKLYGFGFLFDNFQSHRSFLIFNTRVGFYYGRHVIMFKYIIIIIIIISYSTRILLN